MASKRIGFDIDGVLADFNASFIHRVIDVTEEDRFPPMPFDIPCWDYPQHFGYSEAQVNAVWADIVQDESFWYNLEGYQDTFLTLNRLSELQRDGSDIYFVTQRMGARAKAQTEMWLMVHGFQGYPTVLISGSKGLCAQALKLDLYIDDRWENTVAVAGNYVPVLPGDGRTWIPSETKTFLLDSSWNQNQDAAEYGITRVSSPLDIL